MFVSRYWTETRENKVQYYFLETVVCNFCHIHLLLPSIKQILMVKVIEGRNLVVRKCFRIQKILFYKFCYHPHLYNIRASSCHALSNEINICHGYIIFSLFFSQEGESCVQCNVVLVGFHCRGFYWFSFFCYVFMWEKAGQRIELCPWHTRWFMMVLSSFGSSFQSPRKCCFLYRWALPYNFFLMFKWCYIVFAYLSNMAQFP